MAFKRENGAPRIKMCHKINYHTFSYQPWFVFPFQSVYLLQTFFDPDS